MSSDHFWIFVTMKSIDESIDNRLSWNDSPKMGEPTCDFDLPAKKWGLKKLWKFFFIFKVLWRCLLWSSHLEHLSPFPELKWIKFKPKSNGLWDANEVVRLMATQNGALKNENPKMWTQKGGSKIVVHKLWTQKYGQKNFEPKYGAKNLDAKNIDSKFEFKIVTQKFRPKNIRLKFWIKKYWLNTVDQKILGQNFEPKSELGILEL